MLIVKFKDSWADEMNLAGFQLFEMKEWVDYLEHAENVAWPQTYYCGTNEEIEYKDFNEFKSKIEAEWVTESEASSIKTLLGKKFGFFPDIRDWETIYDENV